MKYIVTTKEVWDQGIEIEADSKEEAIRKVIDGDGKALARLFEYSHYLESSLWNIEEVNE